LLAIATLKLTSLLPGRFVCVENTYSMQEISRRCKVHFPDYTFPKRQLPNFLMYLNAMFDERISWYRTPHFEAHLFE